MPILMYKGVNLSGSGMSASSSLDDASENSVATTKLTNELNITKAPLESPVFTGTPEVPTAEGGSNSNQIANTEFVKAQIDNLTKAINDATALRASLEAYGLTKVTNSSAVTDSTGLALAATEKNASIDGTLANQISQLNSDLMHMSKKIPLIFNYKSMQISSPSDTNASKNTKRTFTFNTIITGLTYDNFYYTQNSNINTIDQNHIQWTPPMGEGYGNLSIVTYLIPGGKYERIVSENVNQILTIAISFYESDGSFINFIILDSSVTVPLNAYYSVISFVISNSNVGITHTIEGSFLCYSE